MGLWIETHQSDRLNHRLGEDSRGVLADTERYQCLVGRLIYLSHTCLDIAYFVSVVSQFMHAPLESI